MLLRSLGVPGHRWPEVESPANLAAEQEVVTDPEGAADGGTHVTCRDIGPVGALEGGDVVVVAADHVSRTTEALEIRRSQRRVSICDRERLEDMTPSRLCEGITAPPALRVAFGDVDTSWGQGYGKSKIQGGRHVWAACRAQVGRH